MHLNLKSRNYTLYVYGVTINEKAHYKWQPGRRQELLLATDKLHIALHVHLDVAWVATAQYRSSWIQAATKRSVQYLGLACRTTGS